MSHWKQKYYVEENMKKRRFKDANIQRNSIYYLGKRLTNTHSSYAIPNYAIKNSY